MFLATLLQWGASLVWTAFSWLHGCASARIQFPILKRPSRILSLCPVERYNCNVSMFLSRESIFFPLASAVQSLGFLCCLFCLPPWVKRKNWHHNTYVSAHSGCIYFSPLSDPAQQICYLWQTFILFQQSMFEHLLVLQFRGTGAVIYEQMLPHSEL